MLLIMVSPSTIALFLSQIVHGILVGLRDWDSGFSLSEEGERWEL